ncbi:MAG: MaoC family dehydratase N-terminal domain-containing protein [Proteobacteria bacterium]|nr:MaoC family dehydratase N-terminal domain-containing protein [Pseudomonadota bacterium]
MSGEESRMEELPPEIAARVGQVWYTEETTFEIQSGHIQTSCASVENGNPIYWDEKAAERITGGPTAPLSMISVWFRRHQWAPDGVSEQMPYQIHFDLKRELDLPEAIMTHNELVFGVPVRPGDRLTARQSLASVSDPKRTKLGVGRFWVIEQEYTNQRGEQVCFESITGYGYRRHGDDD